METGVTDENGQIALTKLKPGTYLVTETKTLPDYVLDAPPQTVQVTENDAQTLTFTNTPKGCLVVKKIDSVTHEPLFGVKFEVKGCNGCDYPAGTYTTDSNGMFRLSHIPSGCYSIVETQAKDGYRLDDTVHTVKVEAGACKEVAFENEPLGGLLIKKMSASNKEPLSDVTFTVLTSDGTPVGTSNGQFRTNADGYISIPDLAPGTYIVKETQAKPGYLLDDTPQTITIKDHQTYLLEVFNKPKGNLVIVKTDSQTGEALPGVEFKITTASGELVPDNEGLTSSNGIYKTDKNGEIVLSKLKPGTYVITETKTLDDYILDAPSQTVVIESDDTQVITFTNTKKGCLVITKVDSVTHEPLAGVKFEIKGCNGNSYPSDIYTTNSSGVIQLDHIPSGDYTIMETQAKDGYRLDDAAQVVNVEAGKTRKITVENEPLGGLLLKKMDSFTKEPLSEVVFKITRTDGTVVGESDGEYRTDERGYISIPDLAPGGYVVEEVQAKPGYLLDNTPKNIEIKDHQTYVLEFFNQPKGGLLIVKKDSQTGEPLAGVEFKVTTANGEFVANNEGLTSTNGIYVTNEDGQIEITQLKPGTYTVTETKTLEDYVLDAAPQTVVVDANDQQTLTFTNTKKGCLVITKIDSVTHEPLSGVKFKIQGCNGNSYPEGDYTTDSNGVIRLDHLPSGDYTVAEVQAKDGYRLDDTVKTINIEAGKTKEITFENAPLGGLLIRKTDASTKEPISGVKFKITRTDGALIGTANGEFETDEKGYISLPDLAPGSYIVTETLAKAGYLLDNTPKTIEVKDHQLYTLDFYNQPMGGLIIHKLDSNTKKPLQGVQFKITTVDGTFVPDKGGKLSSNGLYFTDENGQIVLSDLAPSTYIVTEVQTIDGYTIDEATRSQTVVVNTDDTQTLYFYNTPISGLTLIKEDEETHARIPGVTFEVRKLNGEIIGNYTTGDNGIVVVPKLDNGWYEVIELKAAAGYKLDSTPHQIEIKNGENAQLTVTNRKGASILLRKIDSVTGNGIYGVKFLISDANRNPVMEVETDQDGYIYVDKSLDNGKYFIREIQPADGYIADNTVKTFNIEYGSTSEITWKNTPILAQIQIVKKSADDNTYNGFPAGTLLEGAVFEIVDKAGNVVDTVKTNERGLASSKPLPLSRYIVREIQAPDFYAINPTETTVYLEHEGQIERIEVLDESSFTNVSIGKRGYTQIVPGQEIRYDFSRIANNSTVALSSFYWRDTLPAAAPLQKIVTGTYNQQLSYKIVFKTNQRDYTSLADNLLTSQNYVLDASPTALGLASNEYVTEVMFSFGTVKAGFAQVEAPHIYCKALSNLKNNSSFVNQADVGGLWGTRWIMATDRWVTTVYSTQPAPKLPKTGY